MFFALSKLLLFFLYPIVWVLALLLISIFSGNIKTRKRLLIVGAITLYLFSNHFLINQFAKVWDINTFPPENKTYNCVIVLGGFSGGDNIHHGHFNQYSDRFIEGLKLLNSGKARHILITSGNGNLLAASFREAFWVQEQLKKFNVPDSAVLIESNSRNTIENAAFSRKLLQQTHLPGPYLLVTSAFQMRRALMIFKKQNFAVDAYPCNFLAGRDASRLYDIIPDAEALDYWQLYIKEMVGYIVDKNK